MKIARGHSMPSQQNMYMYNGLAALRTIPFLHRNGLTSLRASPSWHRNGLARTASLLAYGQRSGRADVGMGRTDNRTDK